MSEREVRLEMRIEELEAQNAKLLELITKIANIVHHGGLIGFTTEAEALRAIRRATLNYWDGDECARLQIADMLGRKP